MGRPLYFTPVVSIFLLLLLLLLLLSFFFFPRLISAVGDRIQEKFIEEVY